MKSPDFAFASPIKISNNAVIANESLAKKGKKKFKKQIEEGRLQIINCAISEMDNQKLSFFISDADQESSINEQMARNGGNVKVQEVMSIS